MHISASLDAPYDDGTTGSTCSAPTGRDAAACSSSSS